MLKIFEKVFETTNSTLEPEILYDSTKYCTKDETRKAGPFYVGTDSYRQKMTPMTIKLRRWQTELLQEIKIIENDNARDRKVFWIEDSTGGPGKSTFSKFLSFGQKDWKVKKLPIDSPNRIRMAVCKILQKEDVDMFTFDFTRTMGEETSMNDLSRDRWMSYVITPEKALAARKWDTDMHQWVFLPVSYKTKTKGE